MALKSYALTTTSRVKDFADFTTNATEEAVLTNLINMVTEYIENYTGRRFQETAYSNELLDGQGTNRLFLSQFPVSSTDTINLDYRTSVENEEEWGDIDSSEYFVEYDSGIIFGQGESKFNRRLFSYRCSYTAGYDFDNSASFLADTEAGDVEYVAWMLTKAAWNRRRGDDAITSEKIGDYSVTFMKALFENPDAKAILDNYVAEEILGVMSPRNT